MGPMVGASLGERLKATALAAGADAVGIASAEPFPDVAATLWARVADGTSGPLRQTYRDPATASDPRATFPWALRVVALGRSYVPRSGGAHPGPGVGHVARFATSDHYAPLRAAAVAVADELLAAGARAEVMVDDPRLVDRAVAVRAGIGWWGKNTMVLAPGVGPWMLLGSVLTDADLPVDAPQARTCGSCSACLPACPTGALVAPGVLDASRCLSTWLQAPGDIPVGLRVAMGGRIYGCDDCLDACPPGVRLASAPAVDGGDHDLVALLGLDDTELLERFSHWYVPRREARHLRRNLVVALANTGTPDHLPVLAALCAHRSGLVRRHAMWGLARLASRWRLDDVAAAIFDDLVSGESAPDVLAALDAARSTLHPGSGAYPEGR